MKITGNFLVHRSMRHSSMSVTPHPVTRPDAYYVAETQITQWDSISIVPWLGRWTSDRKIASPTPGRCIAG